MLRTIIARHRRVVLLLIILGSALAPDVRRAAYADVAARATVCEVVRQPARVVVAAPAVVIIPSSPRREPHVASRPTRRLYLVNRSLLR